MSDVNQSPNDSHGHRELVRLVKSLESRPSMAAFESLGFREMTRVYFGVLRVKILNKLKKIFKLKR